jgi:hypothetical protein
VSFAGYLLISERGKILCVRGLAASAAKVPRQLTGPTPVRARDNTIDVFPGVLWDSNDVSLYSRFPELLKLTFASPLYQSCFFADPRDCFIFFV